MHSCSALTFQAIYIYRVAFAVVVHDYICLCSMQDMEGAMLGCHPIILIIWDYTERQCVPISIFRLKTLHLLY